MPASMIRSRRNYMFAWRWPSDPTGARLSGYLALMQATMAWPLFEAQDPPGCGAGDGEVRATVSVLERRRSLERLRARPRARGLAIAGARAPDSAAARRQGDGDVRHLRGRIRQQSARHDLRERHVHGYLNLVGHGPTAAFRVDAPTVIVGVAEATRSLLTGETSVGTPRSGCGSTSNEAVTNGPVLAPSSHGRASSTTCRRSARRA